MAGATAVVASVVATAVAGADRLLRLLVGVLAALVQAAGVPLLLGMVGLLELPAVVVVHVVLAGAALAGRDRLPPAVPTGAGSEVDRSRPDWMNVVAIAAAATWFAVAIVSALHRRPSMDSDTMEYHISNLASWLQHGNIWHLPFANPSNITATHPGDGELVGLWLVLPTHGDEIAYTMPALFGVLAIVASAVLSREVSGGARRAAALGALAAVAVLAAPDIFVTQADSLETDLVTAASLLACIALLVVARRRPSVAVTASAGAAIGLSLGSKYTALLPAAVTAVAAILLLQRRKDWWWLVPGVIGLAGPWFLRNLLDTGNPLFPEKLGPLVGQNTPLKLVQTTMLHHVVHGDTAILHRAFTFAARLVGPVVLVALAGILLALLDRRDRTGSALVAAIGVAAALGYLATPVSGGGPTGLSFLITSSFRYGLAALLIGSALGAGLAASRHAESVAAPMLIAVLAWDGWRVHAVGPSLRADMGITTTTAAVGMAVAIAVVVVAVGHRTAPWNVGAGLGRRVVVPGVAAGVVVTLVVSFITFRRLDRGRTTIAPEAALLSFGPKEPAVVLGIVDLRALLGPRLERPLIGVSRGGKAHETPFVTEADMRRSILGDRSVAPDDPAMAAALRVAVDASGRSLVVVADTPFSPPSWTPSAGWCTVFDQGGERIYARPWLLPKGSPCRLPVPPGPARTSGVTPIGG